MTKNEKILIIHHGKSLGGSFWALIGLIEKLKVNHPIAVLCPYPSKVSQNLIQHGYEVFIPKNIFHRFLYEIFIYSEVDYFDTYSILTKLKPVFCYFLNKYFFAEKLLKSFNKDFTTIYLNSIFLVDWAYAAKKLNFKCIIHAREPLNTSSNKLFTQFFQKEIYQYSDKIIAISKDNADRLGSLNSGKTSIYYDPIIENNRDKVPIEIQEDLHYFTYVGGELRFKGFEQLVNSLEFLDDSVRIFYLGPDLYQHNPVYKNILRWITSSYFRKHSILKKKLNESKNILKIGKTSHVFSYYRVSKGLISPFHKSHTSLPCLEAMSIGIPSISSNIEGVEELIVNNKNGYIFENNNPKDLAEKINKMAKLKEHEYLQLKEESIKKFCFIYEKNEINL